MLHPSQTINCSGRLLSLKTPMVMGILNVTPDSFFDGGKYEGDAAFRQAEQMLQAGATILDIGGQSTRPNAEIITEETEIERVVDIIGKIKYSFPDAIISIDTFRSGVARQAVAAGADIINDVSGGDMDEQMFQTVADLGVPYVLMHSTGIPAKIIQNVVCQDITLNVLDYFIEKIGRLRAHKVKDIVIDVGFGFGKKMSQNYELLRKMHIFKILDVPILAGLSRKSMIYKTLEITPQEALNGTSVLNLFALQQGAKILRVHDVKEAVETIKLFTMLSDSDSLK